jgi:S-adenosyl-L-methionine hydrolase (adenosine-forming)
MARPVVFVTDYGLQDEFVGVCHGVIAQIAPDVRVIDLTHAIPRQDVLRCALTLGRATRFMPDDAVYLAIVDPGVGSERRALAVRAASGALLVGPDNGVLSLGWQALGGAAAAVQITSEVVILHPVSPTFHGRDVFAPAAAHLASGHALETLGPLVEISSLVVCEVPGPMTAPGVIGARVVGIDGFGNVQLNVSAAEIAAAGLEGDHLTVSGRVLPRVRVFSDVADAAMAVIVDSQGYLAVVVNRGSAAGELNVTVGSTLVIE